MEKCEFCKNILKTKSNLTYHQKTNKKCLNIQKILSVEINYDLKECNFCNKHFNTSNMKKHLLVCKIKKELEYENMKTKIIELENLNSKYLLKNRSLEKTNLQFKKRINEYESDSKNKISELENKISELENKIIEITTNNIKLQAENNIYIKDHQTITNLAKQPKSTTTNTNNILSIQTPLDFNNIDKIKTIINEKYDDSYVIEGQKGVAKFAVEHILTDENGNLSYVCTDPSRNIFKYKNSSGDIRKDVEAKKITNFLIDGGIQDKSSNMFIKMWTDNTGKVDGEKCGKLLEKATAVQELKNDNTVFKKELVCMTTKN